MKFKSVVKFLMIFLVLPISFLFFYESFSKLDIEIIKKHELCGEDYTKKIITNGRNLIDVKSLRVFSSNGAIKEFELSFKGTLIEAKLNDIEVFYAVGVNKNTGKEYFVNADILTKKTFLSKDVLLKKIDEFICSQSVTEKT